MTPSLSCRFFLPRISVRRVGLLALPPIPTVEQSVEFAYGLPLLQSPVRGGQFARGRVAGQPMNNHARGQQSQGAGHEFDVPVLAARPI